MLGSLDAHRAVLPSQRPPSPPPHPHSHSRQPMPEYVHHDPVGPSPYEDASSGSGNNNTNSSSNSNSNNRGNDYLARFGGREPLQESTGNVQHHNHHHHQHSHYPYGQRALPSLSAASSASCTPVLSHTLSAIPAPPILPTQALGSTGVVLSSSSTASQQQQQQQQDQHNHQQHHQGGSGSGGNGGVVLGSGPAAALAAAGGTSALRLRRHQLNMNKQSRHSKNPIYLSPEFCQYRMKQKDKDEQKWPDILEDAFLDGTFPPFLLLLPLPFFSVVLFAFYPCPPGLFLHLRSHMSDTQAKPMSNEKVKISTSIRKKKKQG